MNGCPHTFGHVVYYTSIVHTIVKCSPIILFIHQNLHALRHAFIRLNLNLFLDQHIRLSHCHLKELLWQCTDRLFNRIRNARTCAWASYYQLRGGFELSKLSDVTQCCTETKWRNKRRFVADGSYRRLLREIWGDEYKTHDAVRSEWVMIHDCSDICYITIWYTDMSQKWHFRYNM